jgi:hypothetical protein
VIPRFRLIGAPAAWNLLADHRLSFRSTTGTLMPMKISKQLGKALSE